MLRHWRSRRRRCTLWQISFGSCNQRHSRSLVALEVARNSFHRAGVSKVEQIESELSKLSQAELRQIREWLDDIIEDELEFTPEFERSIQRSEREMAEGKSARVREPKGS